jgi:hypothetical protein
MQNYTIIYIEDVIILLNQDSNAKILYLMHTAFYEFLWNSLRYNG